MAALIARNVLWTHCAVIGAIGCDLASRPPPPQATALETPTVRGEYERLHTVRGIDGAPCIELLMWPNIYDSDVDNYMRDATVPTKGDIEHFARSPVVDVAPFTITDELRITLRGNTSVKWLRMPPRCNGSELSWIGTMRHLRGLCVTNVNLRCQDLNDLAALNELAYLALSGGNITALEIATLPTLQKLQYLELSGQSTTDDVVGQLTGTKMPQLRVLGLNESRITDASIRHVAREFRLEVLGLFLVPNISRACTGDLTSIWSLHSLDVSGSGLCPNGEVNDAVLDLVNNLPRCDVGYRD